MPVSMAEVHAFLIEQTEPVRYITLKLRELVLDALPDADERIQPGNGTLLYTTDGHMIKGGVVYIAPFKDSVNLGFFDGVDLADPQSLLKGTGKRLRHIKFKQADSVETHESAMRDLLRGAWTLKTS